MSGETRLIDVAYWVTVLLVGYGAAAGMTATGRFFEAAVLYLLAAIWSELALNSERDTA